MNPSTCSHCHESLPEGASEGTCPHCLLRLGLQHEPSPPGGVPFQPSALEELQPFFADLEILALLGCGGMGAVYRARQTRLDRVVALKVLPPARGRDPEFAERFLREARALAKLSHRHIVQVHDTGCTGDYLYIVMEYVDGASLRALLQAGTFDAAEAMRLVPQICEAVQYAHDQGVIHRDLKPDNVLVDTAGNVKIADFGLAKLVAFADPLPLTQTHVRMGTPDYMAPEQRRRSATVDHRADIYSLGILFYEMLTGELPTPQFEPPSHRVRVDPRVDRVVERSIRADPAERYQRAQAMQTDVERIAATPGSRPRRRRALLLVLGLVLTGLGVVMAWHLEPWQRPLSAAAAPSASSAPAVSPAPLAAAAPPARNAQGESALEFDGLSSYVAISSLRRDTPGPITLEAWVSAPRPRHATVVFALGGQAECSLNVSQRDWFVQDIGLESRFLAKPYSPGLTHLAYVEDGQEGRFYVNGVLAQRSRRLDVRPPRTSEAQQAWLGVSEFPPSSGRPFFHFRGRLDEVRVSTVARYTGDFTPQARFEPDSATLALYHCDEGTGDVLHDASGNNHPGTLTGPKWVPAEPQTP